MGYVRREKVIKLYTVIENGRGENTFINLLENK